MRPKPNFGPYWALFLCLLFCPTVSCGSETDQHSTILLNLKDVGSELDRKVNEAISEVIYSWDQKPDPRLFAIKLAAFFNRRQAEYWSNVVLKTYTWRHQEQGIYRRVSLEDSPLIAMGGVASTMNVHNVHIGSDKITHFFGVGLLYFLEATNPNLSNSTSFADRIAEAVEFGSYSEKMLWGMSGTGIFSNADLAANFDGMRFYLNLFETDFVSGGKPLLRWKSGKPEIQKQFTIKDFVTPYWNEASLANQMSCSIQKTLEPILYDYCKNPQYAKAAKGTSISAVQSPYTLAGFEFDNYFSAHSTCERALTNAPILCRPPVTRVTNNWVKQATTLLKILKSENSDSLGIFKESIAQAMGYEHSPELTTITTIRLKPLFSLPGCQPIIQKARNEYSAFLNTLARNESTVQSMMRLGLKLGISEAGRVEMGASRSKVNLVFQYSSSRHSEGVPAQRLCINLPVNQNDGMNHDFNTSSKITARVCLHQDQRASQRTLVRSNQYSYKNRNRELTSLSGYFQWDDEEAYIFRTIPRICSGLTILQPTVEQNLKLNEWLPRFLVFDGGTGSASPSVTAGLGTDLAPTRGAQHRTADSSATGPIRLGTYPRTSLP